MQHIYILGGGTFSHIRSHLSLATPAFGTTAKKLQEIIEKDISDLELSTQYNVNLVLTKMADTNSKLVTNEDVEAYIDNLIKDKSTKAIIFNIALTDYEGQIGDIKSHKYAKRMETKDGNNVININPSKKIIAKIRKERKDIFVIGFKTTSNESESIQYLKGLELLKKNSLNLVVANDLVTRKNMIIAPEETQYSITEDRNEVLSFLSKMMLSRMQNKFTRSTVVSGNPVDWNSEHIPSNLREVINYCIDNGAYKPFLGKTAGHFAVKLNNSEILTSIRKTNFNDLNNVGLVKIESKNDDEVIAYGNKPSVGGQSQRIIFKEHPDLDCIVHFHCPVKEEFKDTIIPVKSQWQNECGSHECGKNTSNGLKEIIHDNEKISVVYLDNHGPNIVFNKNTSAEKVISFIDKYFELSQKTGGLFNAIQ